MIDRKQKMFCVVDSTDQGFWGPFTDEALAKQALKWAQKAVDEDARIESVECNPWAKELMAGLLPVKLSLEIRAGIAQDPEIEVTWPPQTPGLLKNTVAYREYFFWAENRTDAILQMARIRVPDPEPAGKTPLGMASEEDDVEERLKV